MPKPAAPGPWLSLGLSLWPSCWPSGAAAWLQWQGCRHGASWIGARRLGQDPPGHASQPDHNPDNSSASRVAIRWQFWHFGSTSGNSGVLIWLRAQENTALRRVWAKIHKVTHRSLMTSRTAIRQFGQQLVGNSRQFGSISGNSGVLKWLKTQEIRQFGAPAVSLLKI